MKFFIKDFFNKYNEIRSFLRIWSHLQNKSLMEKFIFVERLKDCFSMKNPKLTRKKLSFPLRISSLNVTRIWSHLLKKSLMENLIFCAANGTAHTFTLRF